MKKKAYILLDRSGSMNDLWSEAIGSINSYVKNLNDGDIYVAVFDSTSYDVIRNCSRNEYKDINANEVSPRGMTPLLDAAGRIIWNMLDSQLDRSMLIIMTDGHENSSKHFKLSDIKELIKEAEKKNFDVVFLGANFDQISDVSNSFGRTDSSRFANVMPENMTRAMGLAASSTNAYYATGKLEKMLFDDKTKAELETKA